MKAAPSPKAEARRSIEWGYKLVAVGSDLSTMAMGADALARAFKA